MESTLKRTWAEVDLDALAHNYEVICRHVGEKTKLLGVIKADAYGHGAVPVAKELEALGASYLAVSNIDECEEVRLGGVALPVLMLGFTPADQAERILALDMTQAVQSLDIAEAFSDAAVKCGKKMKVHIKLDTRMGRLGFLCDEAHFDESLRDILAVLRLPGLDVEGVFTHFCVADEEGEENVAFTRTQHERFLRMIGEAETRSGFRFRLRHCCNAGGIVCYPEWAGDMVRCGIILYGSGSLAEKMGMEPVMSLKTRVATVRALKYHGGVPKAELNSENLEALEKGLPNLLQHVDNVKNVYGLPCVVAVNAFPTDTKAELDLVEAKCRELGVNVRLSEVWAKGGEGGKALAEEVVRLCEEPNHFQFVYDVNDSIEDKLNAIATKVYHADGVVIAASAKKQLKQLTELGFDKLPICMAKTQFSFSDDASKLGAPRGFKITVRDLKVNAGAGFLVAKTGDIMTMPGLPKVPSAEKIDVDENGRITGLF